MPLSTREDEMAKIFIGVAWPYANGPIHVGGVAGCYLPPDIFARYHRMKGNEVLMVSGSDMHGTPVTVRAEEEGVSPEELAQRFHEENTAALDKLGLMPSFSLWLSTEDEAHKETAKAMFLRLYERAFLYEKEQELPFCPTCQRTLPDRYVEGTCPLCDYEDARGDQCDECGKLLDPDQLVKPRCKTCDSAPEFVTRSHFFFKLSDLEEDLKAWMANKDHWKPHVLNFSKNYLEMGLKDRPVTRDTKWGIEVPIEGHENKRIYVWFEAFMGYYSMAVEWARRSGNPDAWKDYWQNPDCRHYYFLGKDNIPFHTIFWPAVLMAHGDLQLPYDVPANAFMRFEGAQFSKSRGISLALKDILERFDADALRYYITNVMPENRDADFSWDELIAKNNNELVATYGNFVHRTLSFTHKNFGVIPPSIPPDNPDREAVEEIKRCSHDVAALLEKCEFKRGIKRAMELARFGNQYLDAQAPWNQIKEDRDKCGKTLYTAIHISRALAVIMAPYLPFSSQRLWESLGEEGDIAEVSWDEALAAPEAGRTLAEPKPLFEKLEEMKMEDRVEKEWPADMGRLDLRIGEIESVEDHPDADKLIVMHVNIGKGTRQLVAGLKQYYSKEDLAGKKIVVLCNLQPARLRGVESQGMLLAAVKDEDVSILVPEGDAAPGDEIRGTFGHGGLLSFPDFKKMKLEIAADGYAEFVGKDGGRFQLHTLTAKVRPDKAMPPGAKIE
ncbi:MAG: methionine--tRNA ligase [Candidatus Proteinoplasmatales archaeon SG8-5]|nr:MAG: methionine--tRNA ligase [Candidatus Proteinoplasmatales archaeon SG8-5]